MKIAVVTSLIGPSKDHLQPVDPAFEADASWTVYSDCMVRPPIGWTLKPPPWVHEDQTRTARYPKLNLPKLHPEVDYWIWHDASHTLTQSPAELVATYLPEGKADMALFKHPERCCIFKEILACIRLRKEDHTKLDKLAFRYKSEGHPYHWGLFETGCFIARNCAVTKALFTDWWSELSRGSKRDQISLPVVLRRANLAHRPVRISIMPGRGAAATFFTFVPHR